MLFGAWLKVLHVQCIVWHKFFIASLQLKIAIASQLECILKCLSAQADSAYFKSEIVQ